MGSCCCFFYLETNPESKLSLTSHDIARGWAHSLWKAKQATETKDQLFSFMWSCYRVDVDFAEFWGGGKKDEITFGSLLMGPYVTTPSLEFSLQCSKMDNKALKVYMTALHTFLEHVQTFDYFFVVLHKKQIHKYECLSVIFATHFYSYRPWQWQWLTHILAMNVFNEWTLVL